jgi:hypothetical protein
MKTFFKSRVKCRHVSVAFSGCRFGRHRDDFLVFHKTALIVLRQRNDCRLAFITNTPEGYGWRLFWPHNALIRSNTVGLGHFGVEYLSVS